MQALAAVTEFKNKFPSVKRWVRAADALEALETMPADQMRSIGDSLTYVRTADVPEGGRYVGHRRYFSILRALEQPLTVCVAPRTELVTDTAYSDLSDKEFFAPPTVEHRVVLQPGKVLILEINQAYRIEPGPQYGLVRLTVEAVTFHNK